MSPEQAVGTDEVDRRSDVYSLGTVVFEMLCGHPPFTAASTRALIARRFTETAPRIASLVPDVPNHVDEAVAAALSFEPDDRPATAGALARLLSGKRPEAEPDDVDGAGPDGDAPRRDDQRRRHALGGRAPLRQPERRPAERLPLRRHHRGDHDHAQPPAHDPRGGAQLVVRVQGAARGRARDRRAARRDRGARRERAAVGHARTRRRAARGRAHRLPAVVRPHRSFVRRRLRDPGRHRARHLGRALDDAAAGVDHRDARSRRGRRVRALPARAVRAQQADRGRPAIRGALLRGRDGSGSGVRARLRGARRRAADAGGVRRGAAVLRDAACPRRGRAGARHPPGARRGVRHPGLGARAVRLELEGRGRRLPAREGVEPALSHGVAVERDQPARADGPARRSARGDRPRARARPALDGRGHERRRRVPSLGRLRRARRARCGARWRSTRGSS